MAPRYLLIVALAAGCAGHGVRGDGSSVSYGPPRSGSVVAAAELPRSGQGYWRPPAWQRRGLRYGTDELVSLVVHVGRELVRERPDAVISVADMSLRGGGPSAWHRSHQTGRDVDLMFLSRDASGELVRATRMHRFDKHGRSFVGKGNRVSPTQPGYTFDDAANWAVVRALIDNTVTEIQYIFISDELKQRLIEHARSVGEPESIIARAGYLLQAARSIWCVAKYSQTKGLLRFGAFQLNRAATLESGIADTVDDQECLAQIDLGVVEVDEIGAGRGVQLWRA